MPNSFPYADCFANWFPQAAQWTMCLCNHISIYIYIGGIDTNLVDTRVEPVSPPNPMRDTGTVLPHITHNKAIASVQITPYAL